jgi:hypothetical protein
VAHRATRSLGLDSREELKPLKTSAQNMPPDRRRLAVAGHRRDIDDLLAAELARGKTLQDAAESVGCGERTARRRWAEPEFKAKVAAIRAELIDRTSGTLAENLNLLPTHCGNCSPMRIAESG